MVTRDEELKWAYLLDPCFELTNSAGKPLTDGYIEVYIAGSRNKYYCASDFNGTLHPFQIPLDSLGSNIVLADPDNAYDVYVYNRFGSLVMSRYNVTPADGGAVISNTERINDLEELMVSAVTGLQGQIDDINDELENKKDKQEEYSVYLTPTQTVSAIIQDENGVIQVITQDIDLPEEVPNVNIVSPASTISVTEIYDPETNRKTFELDISDLGRLEYGQYMNVYPVTDSVVLSRIKGNLDVTDQGKVQLHAGNSYHITVRGTYTPNDTINTEEALEYVETVSNSRIKVDVDNTIAGPQHFELSYDLFKLGSDTDYLVAFNSSNGTITELTVEIHSLTNISVIDTFGHLVPGWGIEIVSGVISVDPNILNDYTTHTEVIEAVTSVTAMIPEAQVQSDWDEQDSESPAYIQNKPDLTEFVDRTELVEMVTAVTSDFSEQLEGKQDVLEPGQYISIENNVISATGLQPEGDYATRDDLQDAMEAVTALIPEAQVQSDWTESDTTDPAYIQNKPVPKTLVAGPGIEITDTVTGVEITAAVTAIEGYVTEQEFIEVVSAVTGTGDYGQFYCNTASGACVMGKIKGTIDVTNDGKIKLEKGKSYHISVRGCYKQSSASNVEDTIGFVEYVTNNAIQINVDRTVTSGQYFDLGFDLYNLSADTDYYVFFNGVSNSGVVQDVFVDVHTILGGGGGNGGGGGGAEYNQGWGIVITNNTISVNPNIIPDISNLATKDEVSIAIATATGAQINPDWNNSNPLSKAYIQNKPEELTLVGGNNVEIDIVGASAIINVTGGGGTQVQSDWTEDDTSDPSYIKNKPEEQMLIAGNNVEITIDGASAIISASASGGHEYTAGQYISIDSNDVISVTGVAAATAIPDTSNMVSYTGNIAINHIQLVSTLPGSPDANTLYLIPEA